MANPLYDTLFGGHAGKTDPFLHLADGSELTYQAFLEMAARYAHTMTQIGLEVGDRVAAPIQKSTEAPAP